MSEAIFNVLMFKIGSENFVSLLSQIDETLKCPSDFMVLPGTQTWVLGATKYAGKELPLIDLKILGSIPGGEGGLDEILVVSKHYEFQGRRHIEKIGLVVAEIVSISKLDGNLIPYKEIESQYFSGAELGEIKINGAKSKLLDLQALVESEDLTKVSMS